MALTVEKVNEADFPIIAPQLESVGTVDPFASVDMVQEPGKCTLHVALRDGRIVSYLHRYLNTLSIYRLAGEAEGGAELLGNLSTGPAILMCRYHLREAVACRFPAAPSYLEHLMTVDRLSVRAAASHDAGRLSPDDAQQLLDLYSTGEFSSRAAFNTVESYRALIEKQATFGVRTGGTIVSAATAFSGNSSFGMVGSVFTSTEHRGKGYGTAVASAATCHILGQSPWCLLYVRTDNMPAIRSYRRIGYRVKEDWAFFDFGTGIVP